MAYAQLKREVCELNLQLAQSGLVLLSFGNASGVDRQAGVMAIKPSGVDYDQLRPEQIVVISLATGKPIEGDLRPSSDTPTHWTLYRAFESIAGVIHTHSTYATAWAQAGRPIPCLGTTHADHFHGEVPLSRDLTEGEIREAYELNTGKVIVESFHDHGLTPDRCPGVLIPHHGPFAWGVTPEKALENAVALEVIAKMASRASALNPDVQPIPQTLLDKHFFRKHGRDAYYGQK
jgi:L-ribulose-5-phosphate 4-epimerase